MSLLDDIFLSQSAQDFIEDEYNGVTAGVTFDS